jgi:hypothetical protein
MSYFNKFSSTLYTFDNGEKGVMQNLSSYAEILDEVKINSSFYKNYYIRNGERPDNVAFILYENPQLHWTLYLMNNHLREQGWPLDHTEIVEKAKRDLPYVTLSVDDLIVDDFAVGSTVQANNASNGDPSYATGTIISRNLDLGQLVIETTGTSSFNTTDIITAQDSSEQLQLVSVELQYLSAHHYLQDGEIYTNRLDLSTEPYVEVTNLEFYVQENDKLRSIIVLKPQSVNRVVQMFRQAISQQ